MSTANKQHFKIHLYLEDGNIQYITTRSTEEKKKSIQFSNFVKIWLYSIKN